MLTDVRRIEILWGYVGLEGEKGARRVSKANWEDRAQWEKSPTGCVVTPTRLKVEVEEGVGKG